MEGQAVNARDKVLYTAMSHVQKGMLEGSNKNRPRDHIRLAGAKADLKCGAVYRSTLSGGIKDSEGNAIDSDWVAVDMTPLVAGADKPAGQTAYGRLDTCDTDRVANPDNIKFSETLRTLFIGEDSSHHLNNFVWAYHVDAGTLVRILSAPAAAENTGLQVVENVGGHAYIMANIQHPAARHDLKNFPGAVEMGLGDKTDKRGIVGYIGGMPAVVP